MTRVFLRLLTVGESDSNRSLNETAPTQQTRLNYPHERFIIPLPVCSTSIATNTQEERRKKERQNKINTTMVEDSTSMEKMVFMAKLAEQTERYEEMKSMMKNVELQKKKLTMEDRNLLSVAYKNVVGARRASWRVLNSMLAISDSAEAQTKYVFSYKQKFEQELNEICQEVLELLDHLLKNKDLKAEESVFFYKMKGD